MFPKRLREAMDLRGVSVAQLAEQTGIGESTIFRYLSGEREPIYGNFIAIASALNVDLDFLAGRDGTNRDRTLVELIDRLATDVRSRLGISTAKDAPTRSGPAEVLGQIPVIGRITDGPNLQFTDEGHPSGEPLYAIPRLGDDDPHAYGIIFEGDSMTSRVLAGDVVVCSPDVDWESGDLVLLRKASGEMAIKEISDRQSHFVLRSYNPSYELEEIQKSQVSFAHRLISIRPGEQSHHASAPYET